MDLAEASYAEIALGTRASYGLSPTGRVYSWGWNQWGQLGDGQNQSSSLPVAVDTTGVLAGKTITQVAGGYGHAAALDSEGHVYTWGQGTIGALGDGAMKDSAVPVAVDTTGVLAGKTITQIAAGNHYSLALDSDGHLYAWGANVNGTLGNNGTATSPIPVAVDTSGALNGKTIVHIVAGGMHVIVMDAENRLYAWGNNAHGQLGTGGQSISRVPLPVDQSGALAGVTVAQIRAGFIHTLALDTQGKVYAWGNNDSGQLGNDSTAREPRPIEIDTSDVTGGRTITQIEAGLHHSLLLDSANGMAAWGENAQGQLGNGSTDEHSLVPVLVDSSGTLAGRTITDVASYGGTTAVRDSTGQVFTWGDGRDGQLGNETTSPSALPVATTMHAVFFGSREFRATGVTSEIAGRTLAATTPAHPAGTAAVLVGLSGDEPSSTGVASFDFGTAVSVNGTLPGQTTIRPFDPIQFTVSATGDEAPNAEWEHSRDGVTWGLLSGGSATSTPTRLVDGVAQLGETTLSLDTTTTDTTGSTYYRASFRNALGQAYSSVARVTVQADVSLDASSIRAAPTSITADGASTSTITVNLVDEHNNPMPGHDVTVATTAGAVGAVTGHGDGSYTATLRSSTTAGAAVVGFTVAGQQARATTTVTFTSGPTSLERSTVSASPTSITADGASTSAITIRVVDRHDNPVDDRTVVATSTAGQISAVTPQGNGIYTAQLRASTTLGRATVNFTIDSQSAPATATVDFVAGAPSMTASTIDANPEVAIADGRSTSVIRVRVVDDHGHPLSGRSVTISTTSGDVTHVDDYGNGIYAAVFTAPTTSGVATLGFQVDGQRALNTASITLRPGAPSLARSTISVNPTSMPAHFDSHAAITVTVFDQHGNPVPGRAITIISSDASVGSLTHVTDEQDGRYTASIWSWGNPGTVTLTFRIDDRAADRSATMTFFPMTQGAGPVDQGGAPTVEDESLELSGVLSADDDTGQSNPAPRRATLPRTGADVEAPTEGFALLLTSGAALLVVRRRWDREVDGSTGEV